MTCLSYAQFPCWKWDTQQFYRLQARYSRRIALFRKDTVSLLRVIILGKCLWNENVLFLGLGIYFHSFNRAFVTVCSWMMVETDLLLIPTELHSETRPNGSPQNVTKGDPERLPKCTPAGLLDRFYAAVCNSVRREVSLGSVTLRLALLFWCGMANIILGVYFKRSLWCSYNEHVWQKWFVCLKSARRRGQLTIILVQGKGAGIS
jgi:hypothetical protein